ncbi:endonuclease/exonuclease/phosphatase family protein [Halogeometricum borinquense]|uniref:Endonuclease/exonuclease/phosphatase family protein n=1 Tax=Halogeometricum borinquense TaxID=60847 RepID=A0A6C0UKU3_9EURY|nr:endonuclease/exonuclease/phosphatase family protein [Halogeometricum borinquense]QIB74951.1 endonuclease/exonuclease/phosphatase family protein [Halogeometricum borinquense]QIQ76050.1 endonuclease/exonuclease/phosphatase family protein [Halogeometricum borinquense]
MTAPPVRVLSFNVRYDTDDDGPDAWPHRRDDAVRLVRYHRPDVVCLQEPLKHQLDAFRDGLDEYEWVAVPGTGGNADGATDSKETDDAASTGESVPVGYDASRFSLEDSETFWLSETPEEPGSVGWDANLPRILTRATLQGESGETFHVASVHLDNGGVQARLEGAKLARDRLAQLDGPVILAGDCNATPDSDPYEAVTEAFADARHVAKHGHHGPEKTMHHFTGDPTERIDYVFVRDCDVRLSATLTDRTREGYPSDHFPVVADVLLR